MAADVLKNLAFGTVLFPPTPPNLGTSMTMHAGHSARFPAPPFTAAVWPFGLPADPSNCEFVRVTAIAGDVWTITRQAESTLARTIEANDYVAQPITAKFLADYANDLKAYTDAKVAAIPAPSAPTFIPPRVQTIVDAAALTPNVGLYDVISVNALAQALTINAPIGAVVDMQNLVFRIRDTGIARALVWNAYWYPAAYVPLPTTTTPLKVLHVACRYSVPYGRFVMVALTQEP